MTNDFHPLATINLASTIHSSIMGLNPEPPMTDTEAKCQWQLRLAEEKARNANTELKQLKKRHVCERSIEESNKKLGAQRAKVKADIRRRQH
jgi:hypothetical protein